MGKKHLISFRIDEIQNEELETLFKFTIKPRADFLRELLFLGLKSYREDMGKVRRKHEFDSVYTYVDSLVSTTNIQHSDVILTYVRAL